MRAKGEVDGNTPEMLAQFWNDLPPSICIRQGSVKEHEGKSFPLVDIGYASVNSGNGSG